MTEVKVVHAPRLLNLMRAHGWGHKTPRDGIRRRLYALALDRHHWWDWGSRLMILTGTDMGGNWDEPSPPTWWYRHTTPRYMWRTRYPRHPLSTFEVITDYDTFIARTEGLDEDGMYEWNAICVGQDGDLELGHRYWGGAFYGLSKPDAALLRRYLRMWHRLDWFGVRTWLYLQGLHATVNSRKPFSCQAIPPRGGYKHWACRLPKKHGGAHRFNNYVWDDNGTTYDPETSG